MIDCPRSPITRAVFFFFFLGPSSLDRRFLHPHAVLYYETDQTSNGGHPVVTTGTGTATTVQLD